MRRIAWRRWALGALIAFAACATIEPAPDHGAAEALSRVDPNHKSEDDRSSRWSGGEGCADDGLGGVTDGCGCAQTGGGGEYSHGCGGGGGGSSHRGRRSAALSPGGSTLALAVFAAITRRRRALGREAHDG